MLCVRGAQSQPEERGAPLKVRWGKGWVMNWRKYRCYEPMIRRSEKCEGARWAVVVEAAKDVLYLESGAFHGTSWVAALLDAQSPGDRFRLCEEETGPSRSQVASPKFAEVTSLWLGV